MPTLTTATHPLVLELQQEIQRRRTFAIISHPDAGKTTLTEKLLLYGGAVNLAGSVKAKRSQRHATSDWMKMEQQRGISITSTVLQFEYEGYQLNLLDTPGHQDFSEDTYRTLAAADNAIMLLDGAKGIEPQTLKLFEACKLRQLPLFTFNETPWHGDCGQGWLLMLALFQDGGQIAPGTEIDVETGEEEGQAPPALVLTPNQATGYEGIDHHVCHHVQVTAQITLFILLPGYGTIQTIAEAIQQPQAQTPVIAVVAHEDPGGQSEAHPSQGQYPGGDPAKGRCGNPSQEVVFVLTQTAIKHKGSLHFPLLWGWLWQVRGGQLLASSCRDWAHLVRICSCPKCVQA